MAELIKNVLYLRTKSLDKIEENNPENASEFARLPQSVRGLLVVIFLFVVVVVVDVIVIY